MIDKFFINTCVSAKNVTFLFYMLAILERKIKAPNIDDFNLNSNFI